MNRNIFKHILILLLSSTAVLSCSMEQVHLGESLAQEGNAFVLVISGSASDLESSLPIEEIRIVLKATEKAMDGTGTVYEKSAYTDNKGMFTMQADGFCNPISVTLTAEDPNGRYESATHEIPMITWESSYNMTGNTFYINDCSFYLEKVR